MEQTANVIKYSNYVPGDKYAKPALEEDKEMAEEQTVGGKEEVPDTAWDVEEMGDLAPPEDKAALGTAVTKGKGNTVPAPKPKKPKEDLGREMYETEFERAKRTYDDKDPFGNVRVPKLYSFDNSKYTTMEDIKTGLNSGFIKTNVADLYQAARNFCGPKAKKEQIDKIMATNQTDVSIAYQIGAANVKNVTNENLKAVGEKGLDISQYCKFGKSKKLYKSIKVPKVLFGLRAINPPSPAMFVMRFLNFIWRVLGTGISRVPGPFLRIGLAFFKNLGGVTTKTKMFGNIKRVYETPFTKKMLLAAFKTFENLAPGLLGAYQGYLSDTKMLTALKTQVRAQNAERRNMLVDKFYSEIMDIKEASDMFARAVGEASSNIPKDIQHKTTDGEMKMLLAGFTDGPKKAVPLKAGKYTNITFGQKKKAS